MTLLDCYLSKLKAIGGINLVKISVSQGMTDLTLFSNIGSCDNANIKDARDLNKLLECYMVWYKPNFVGQSGWQFAGSMNYKVNEYIKNIKKSVMDIPTNIKNLVDSFSAEINANVDILLAHDLSIDKTIIVDGTKRALALLLIKDEAPEVLNKIIRSSYSINIITLNSQYSKIIFPCDFIKLCL